jgi:diaminopimelate decarboxylase
MFNESIIFKFLAIPTPFYYYDVDLLRTTLETAINQSRKHGYKLHYALKANANDRILQIISGMGYGADCVSGNEIEKAVRNGFSPEKTVFAGVGKSDKEILTALKNDILCFNCESGQELEVINALAAKTGRIARVALRINPNVYAHTHHYITTGLEENKFGINPWDFDSILEKLKQQGNLKFIGLHFHIGSQITDFSAFRNLCIRANEINLWFHENHFTGSILNLGGGLGVDYKNPDSNPIPDFEQYFHIFRQLTEPLPGQEIHMEPGRALVAQCGSLITKVLYIKEGVNTNFAICDAGMTELIRPALYQAYHKIENISAEEDHYHKYDVVGPICESSDSFGKAVLMPKTRRGDLIALRTTGAYGEVMASQYNLRDLPHSYYSDEI